jgi:hypothetical protein
MDNPVSASRLREAAERRRLGDRVTSKPAPGGTGFAVE